MKLLHCYVENFGKLHKFSYTFSDTLNVIEGENGSLTFDKLNAPTEIKLKMRGEEWQTLDYTPIENNMVYEIDAFADMVGGVLSSLPFITATECAMRVVDEVYRTRKISKYFQNT